jgi:lipoprotein-releasing system permease protein
MFTPFERAVAFRYLRARKGERFVSVTALFSLVGISLGVAALIIVMAVMNGFRQDLIGRIIGLNGHLTVQPASGRALPDPAALAARLRAIPGVEQVSPTVEGQVLLTGQSGGAAGGLVRGILPGDLQARPVVAEGLRGGSLAAFGTEEDTAVLGLRLALRMNLRLGDRITLVLPQARAGDVFQAPRQRAFRVVGVFDSGLAEADGRQVYIPLAAAQAFFGLGEAAVSELELFVEDPAQVTPVTQAVRAALGGLPVRVADWQRTNSSVYAAVVVERNVMFLILTLIILVAAFNIVSSLTMLVKDKGADIAILRTMGAGRGAILRVFLLCGAAVGGAGTLAGLALGLLFCRHIEAIRQLLMRATGTTVFDPEIYFLTQIPAVVDPAEVAQVVGLGLALSLLATLWPSWRAARMDPVEALRNE